MEGGVNSQGCRGRISEGCRGGTPGSKDGGISLASPSSNQDFFLYFLVANLPEARGKEGQRNVAPCDAQQSTGRTEREQEPTGR